MEIATGAWSSALIGHTGSDCSRASGTRGDAISRADSHLDRPPPERNGRGVVVATPSRTREQRLGLDAPGTKRAASGTGRPQAMAPVRHVTPASIIRREPERRATELLEQGKAGRSALAFDGLVMNNPLYEPRTTEMTPEALATFRRASEGYSREGPGKLRPGKAALAVATTTWRWTGERGAGHSRSASGPRLTSNYAIRCEDLIEEAKLAAATANEMIYSESDLDVMPPRQLSRPMPSTARSAYRRIESAGWT